MKKINIGIIGLGTIGTGVYKILKERRGAVSYTHLTLPTNREV